MVIYGRVMTVIFQNHPQRYEKLDSYNLNLNMNLVFHDSNVLLLGCTSSDQFFQRS